MTLLRPTFLKRGKRRAAKIHRVCYSPDTHQLTHLRSKNIVVTNLLSTFIKEAGLLLKPAAKLRASEAFCDFLKEREKK